MCHVCELCKREETEENPVEYRPNPFNYEINGDDTPMYICDECHYELARNI
jgi:hypothetical protein